MSVVTKAALKTYFETGDFPTASQFEDLIDTLYGANIQEAEVELTAAQIIALSSSPVDIVASPGAGKAIEVVSATFYINVTSVFTAALIIRLMSAGGAGAQHQSGSLSIQSATGVYSGKIPDASSTTGERIKANAALQVTGSGVDLIHGTEAGTGSIKVAYRIIDYP